jgi:hypothetical protein
VTESAMVEDWKSRLVRVVGNKVGLDLACLYDVASSNFPTPSSSLSQFTWMSN